MKLDSLDNVLGKAEKLLRQGKWDEAENLYNLVFNQAPEDIRIQYFLGTLYMQRGCYELASILLQRVTEELPDFAEAWNNLGICRKNQWRKDEAGTAFRKAMNLQPDQADFPSNWAGCYVNEGEPGRALELARRGLAIDPDHVQSRWHAALAYLELQDFAKAWPHHEARLLPKSGCNVTERNYSEDGMTPWWNGEKGLCVIHGEQGLGDEIMFASCIPEMVEHYPDTTFVFECSPRTHDLFERSLPCVVHGTHRLDGSEWRNGTTVDYKIAVGSLPKFCRNDVNDFPGDPYLTPNPKQARSWRKKLAQLSDKPKIGIAWQGGAQNTRIDLRSIAYPLLVPLLEKDATFVSLQYTKSAHDELADIKENTGLVVHHWGETAHGHNLDDLTALISELDLVISVCQTAIHIAGGVGTPCWCLTPAAPAWRYGIHGNMPWYNSVDLVRQQKNETWADVVLRVADDLENWIDQRKLSQVKPAVA